VDPAQFLTAPRVTIVAGKGGVGKTTVTATMALTAARLGLRALVIEIEGKSGLPTLFGKPALDYEEQVLFTSDDGTGEVRARTLTPDDSLVEYLRDHGLKRISKRLAESGALELVATATPGIKDVLMLGKVKQLETRGDADVIIVDAPAAGHAITFLSSAEGILDAVKVGPMETQAREVRALLTDAARCQVMLVTLPEETPVNELIETAYSLEDRIGIKLGPVVVNGIAFAQDGLVDDPAAAAAEVGIDLSDDLAQALVDAATFRRDREALQQEQLERLAKELPLDQVRLPFVFRSDLGMEALVALSETFADQLRTVAAVGADT
jgi:anion-transporting  ArsA/GET3 family ATPase